MSTIGLFEAKTKLSEICDQVERRRESVLITRRGRPIARLEPVKSNEIFGSSVWAARSQWEKDHGPLREDFKLPLRSRKTKPNPLED